MVLYSQRPYHRSCFRCAKCENPIGSKSFTREEDDSVFCEDCYFQKSGKQCAKCKKTFSTSGVWFKNQHYHKSCFSCAFCVQVGIETRILLFRIEFEHFWIPRIGKICNVSKIVICLSRNWETRKYLCMMTKLCAAHAMMISFSRNALHAPSRCSVTNLTI